MAQIIKIKGSKTNANATPSSLVERELASNLVDRCLFGSDGTSVFKYYTGSTKYFDANGYANNANKLGGQTIDYFASADGVADALDEIIASLKGYQPLITSTNKLAYSLISETPTTLSGYGITDAYTKTQVDSALGGYITLATGQTITGIKTYSNTIEIINGNSITDENGNGVLGLLPSNWGGVPENSAIALGTLISPLYFRSNGDNMYHYRNDKGVAYKVLDSSNYSEYALPLSGGTIDGNLNIGKTDNTAYKYIRIHRNNKVLEIANTGDYGILSLSGVSFSFNSNGAYWNSNTLIHSGNIGSQSVDNADKLDGYHAKASNTPFDGIPVVRDDGVMEIGKYIDFHNDNTSNNDYDCRLDIQGGNRNIVHLPSTSGTLALLTDNVASATKLQTSRSIWGQSFDGTGDVSGNLILGESSLRVSNSTTSYNALYLNSTNGLYFGYETSETYNTLLWGKSILFVTGTNGQTRLYIKNDGNVGIGENNPQYKLDVNGTLNAGIYYASITNSNGKNTSGHFRFGKFDEVGGLKLQFGAESGTKFEILNSEWNKALFNVDTSGNVIASGTIRSYIGIYSDGYVSAKGQNTSSDMRLKNVLNDVVLSVKDIANAPSMRFAWKNGGGVDVGSSAQYWQGLLPDAVKEQNSLLEMQYGNIALLSAIAIAKKVETHEERIARLERENEELRTKIDMMERGIA